MKPGWQLRLQRRLLNGGRRAEQEEGLVQQAGELHTDSPESRGGGCTALRQKQGVLQPVSALAKPQTQAPPLTSLQPPGSPTSPLILARPPTEREERLLCITQLKCLACGATLGLLDVCPGKSVLFVCFGALIKW